MGATLEADRCSSSQPATASARGPSHCGGLQLSDAQEKLPQPHDDVDDGADAPTELSSNGSSSISESVAEEELMAKPSPAAFMAFRVNYLLVTLVIMLADGLQGTHLYVLYEGYGFSVASLYCLGFLTGAVTAPISGPLVDKFGRKKAAILYCALEMGINLLEQYPFLSGLIVSRMVGGITTNMLHSVFEAWLDTEYRRRGFDEAQYETIMRDSVVVSNLAAIASGYLAHVLAERFGNVGPFEGAVSCTAFALVVVFFLWSENYGSTNDSNKEIKSVSRYLIDAANEYRSDSRLLRVGIIQGLTMGSLQIFVFLWSPALQEMAQHTVAGTLGLDAQGLPAFGLIFGSFMAAGVIGGLVSPFVRKGVTTLISPLANKSTNANGGTPKTITIDGEGEVRPMDVEFLAAFCYLMCSGLLMVPCIVSTTAMSSFSIAVGSFVLYELFVGVYMPLEGVIRSLYIPSDSRASMMTLPTIIVNIAVSIGVVSTNAVSLQTAFAAISCLMMVSAIMQISLVSGREWNSLSGKVDRLQKRLSTSFSSFSMGSTKEEQDKAMQDLRASMPTLRKYSSSSLDANSDRTSTLKVKGE